MPNQIFCIVPYRLHGLHGTWIFDDPCRGLLQEPFVAGIPEIIDMAVEALAVAGADKGFRLLFSADPFPDAQIALRRAENECGGTWYVAQGLGMRGWVCPAFYRYFDEAPAMIYARCEPLP